MLWRRKPLETRRTQDEPVADDPAVPFAADRFRQHLDAFLALARDEDAGPEAYLHALRAKHERVAALTAALQARALELAELEALLGCVFTARRKLFVVIESIGAARTSAILRDITAGSARPEQRLQALVDAVPCATTTDRDSLQSAQRVRRAAWDFGAEVLHFSAPEHQPLMTRWVWEENTGSGALREFVGSAHERCDLPAGVRAFATSRAWFAAQVRETGIYRDIHWWIDLVLAHAYIGYLGAAAQGHLGAEFLRGFTTREQMRKLLGIDGLRPSGRSRVRRVAAGADA